MKKFRKKLKRFIKRVTISLFVIVLLFFLSIVAIVSYVNFFLSEDDLIAITEDYIKQEIGHDTTIGGINLFISDQLHLSVKNLNIAHEKWAQNSKLLHVESASLKLNILSLLWFVVDIETLDINNVQLALEKNAENDFGFGQQHHDQQDMKMIMQDDNNNEDDYSVSLGLRFVLQETLSLNNILITSYDHTTKKGHEYIIDTFRFGIDDNNPSLMMIDGVLDLNKLPIKITGNMADVNRLAADNNQVKKLPLSLNIKADNATLNITGNVENILTTPNHHLNVILDNVNISQLANIILAKNYNDIGTMQATAKITGDMQNLNVEQLKATLHHDDYHTVNINGDITLKDNNIDAPLYTDITIKNTSNIMGFLQQILQNNIFATIPDISNINFNSHMNFLKDNDIKQLRVNDLFLKIEDENINTIIKGNVEDILSGEKIKIDITHIHIADMSLFNPILPEIEFVENVPMTLSARIHGDADSAMLIDDIKATILDSDISGNITGKISSPIYFVDADIYSKKINANNLKNSIRVQKKYHDEKQAIRHVDTNKEQKIQSAFTIENKDIDYAATNKIQGNLRLKIDNILYDTFSLEGFKADIVNNNNQLLINNLSLMMENGQLTLTADADKLAQKINTAIKIDKLPLFFKNDIYDITAQSNAEITLKAHGDSTHQLIKNMEGNFALGVFDSNIKNPKKVLQEYIKFLKQYGLNISISDSQGYLEKLPDTTLNMRCFALAGNANDGIMTAPLLYMKGESIVDITTSGNGTLNIIPLEIESTINISANVLGGIALPLSITGNIPNIKVNIGKADISVKNILGALISKKKKQPDIDLTLLPDKWQAQCR